MRLYNTLTRTIEEVVPRDEGRIGMYTCGPTVQNVPHFGHARAEMVPDVLRRYLEWVGYEVTHVRNFTDVDDKIIARAVHEGRSAAAVAQEYSRVYEEQMGRLGTLPPHIAPRATGHIDDMVELIEELIANGSAYESGGDVFFAVRSFDGYGRLSGRDVDELRSGARVDTDERKRDPLDFALWKAAKPGEPSWRSPWGRGRPGWHIECSAMAARHLGASFDIHTGGLDLVFPHHENEIAQSEAASGRRFAGHWVHNGLLSTAGQKMSKSLDNFITLADALDRHGPAVLRMFYLAVDYRSPIEMSDERLTEAAAAVDRWTSFLRATSDQAHPHPGVCRPDAHSGRAGDTPRGGGAAEQARERFRVAMDDDLSTPRAQAALFDLVSDGNRALSAGDTAAAALARATLLELTGVLGYDLDANATGDADTVGLLVTTLLTERADARARRDFDAADRIRQRLAAAGVTVEDTPGGWRWHRE